MFQQFDDHELYGAYCWNEALSSAFFRLISTVEVLLRNRIHSTLSLHASGNSHASFDWYNHIALPSKSSDKVRHVTHYYRRRSRTWHPRTPALSPNDVVSKMTFGFWPKLLDVHNVPWADYLPSMLPGHRHRQVAQWSSLRSQDAFYMRLDVINKLRNRIAHFEPIWKQKELLEERRARRGLPPPTVIEQRPSTPSECIQRLDLLKKRTLELLYWLSPERHDDFKGSYVSSHLDWLCTESALKSYAQMQAGIELPMTEFSRCLSSITKKSVKVSVTRNNRRVGTFYSGF